MLRRLEDKGYTNHTVDGRTYVYEAAEPRGRVAAKAVQRIVDWFCNGSIEEVLVGMVDTAMLDQRQLRALADQVAKGKGEGREKMILAILAESALRSLLLGGVVWIGLIPCASKNPHVHMTCGAMVLAASLSMPLLMHWTTVTITLDPSPVPALENLWPGDSPLPETSLPSEPAVPVPHLGENEGTITWLGLATAIYACVAGLLVLRLSVGFSLTWRLVRAAKPISEPWTAGCRVRISKAIHGPVTFGSTILLPPQCADWDELKRRAVLAHEGAHVANRDFYILLLASLNGAVFWFSPFAWWQLIRLAELAEIISDAGALKVVEDKLSYAEILLDLGAARPAGAGRAGNGQGVYRQSTRGAHSRCNHAAGKAGLAQAHLDCGHRSAGRDRFRRKHRLQHANATCTHHGGCGEGCAQPAVHLVLFIGTKLYLRGFPGRGRSVRANDRATKTPDGGGCRWHLFVPGRRRPNHDGHRQRTKHARTDVKPERSQLARRPDRRNVVEGRRDRCNAARCSSAGRRWPRTACSPSRATVTGCIAGARTPRNSRSRPMAPTPLPATRMISLSSCATAR